MESVTCSATADHPRVCGEHPTHVRRSQGRTGSSPRLRGARCSGRCRCICGRIIPASAGSTLTRSIRLAIARDHPRVCGEHGVTWYNIPSGAGSSPRLRGARTDGHVEGAKVRIIPASAGSTCAAYGAVHVCTDHPRVCGEHEGYPGVSGHTDGSSPRLRGAPSPYRARPGLTRLIPASAGSTLHQA